MYLKAAKRVSALTTKSMYVGFLDLTILQCIHMSTHYVVHHKYIIFFQCKWVTIFLKGLPAWRSIVNWLVQAVLNSFRVSSVLNWSCVVLGMGWPITEHAGSWALPFLHRIALLSWLLYVPDLLAWQRHMTGLHCGMIVAPLDPASSSLLS
jgi:hypothetical protein